ncbi:MAG: hypothetical protein NTX50_09965 [Candidatus Sumerlaeota bacterium]|nr:hypothetical protein [Candidatus Sumerlaeota bacterium]
MIVKIMLLLALLGVCLPSWADEIKHRFLAVDESRDQLLYVDQTDPSKDWAIKLPAKHRDIQLIGKNQVMLSSPDGYREYDLADRKMVKEVKGYAGAMSARRLPNGNTILARNFEGVTVCELSPDDKVIRKVSFKGFATRVVRLSPKGTLLFGSGDQTLEGDWNGEVKKITVPGPKAWAYQSLRKPDGNLLVSGGYNPIIFEFDPDGKVVKKWGGKETPDGKSLGYYFFGAMQVLKSGDLMVCNWTGHGAQDSTKGVQILQFNPAGQVVWKWHDPQRAGSIHGIIVLDDLDTSVLNDDVSSVLGPVK